MPTSNRLTSRMKAHIDAGCAYQNNEGQEKISARLERMIDEASEVSAAEISLANGKILIGNASNLAEAQTVSSDLSLAANGAATIANGAVTPAKMATSANLQEMCLILDSPTVAPDAANHLNQDTPWGFIFKQNATIVSAYVGCSAVIAAGDATNHYELNIYNKSAANELLSSNLSLQGGLPGVSCELSADQNANISAGDELVLRVDQLDDGGAGPADLSSAKWRVIVNYRLR